MVWASNFESHGLILWFETKGPEFKYFNHYNNSDNNH